MQAKSSKTTILDFMRSSSYAPQTEEALIETIPISGNLDHFWKDMLELEENGEIIKTRFGTYGLPEKMGLVVGRFQLTSNRFWWTASPCTHNQPPKERCGIPDSAPLPCLQGVPMVHCLSRKLSCPKRRRKNSLSGQGEWMSPGRDGLDGPLLAGQALWDILGLPACPVPGAAP